MKLRDIKSPKQLKANKRSSEAEPESARTRVCIPRSDEEYLSPMHIKLPKPKIKGRKEQKISKNTAEFE